ncbi:MAG: hypothetical protein QM727_01650 [Niabella sp.]
MTDFYYLASIMDARCTLNVGEDFLSLLTQLMNDKAHVDLIVDINGLERANRIEGSVNAQEVALDRGQVIPLSDIIAVNGLFKPDYTCC